MRDLAALETLREHDLVAGHQEAAGLVHADLDIVLVDLDRAAKTQLLHLRGLGGGALLALLLAELILVLAIVHDLADRRPGLGRDLHEIHPQLRRLLHGLVGLHDAKHLLLRADDPDGGDADHVVDPRALHHRTLITAESTHTFATTPFVQARRNTAKGRTPSTLTGATDEGRAELDA